MKLRLLSALCLCAGFLHCPANAATFAVGSMTITGGSFAIDLDGGGIFLGFSFDTIGPNTDLVSGYIGNGGAGRPSTTPDPDSIVGVKDYGGLPINVYTALENLGDDNTPANTQTGDLFRQEYSTIPPAQSPWISATGSPTWTTRTFTPAPARPTA